MINFFYTVSHFKEAVNNTVYSSVGYNAKGVALAAGIVTVLQIALLSFGLSLCL